MKATKDNGSFYLSGLEVHSNDLFVPSSSYPTTLRHPTMPIKHASPMSGDLVPAGPRGVSTKTTKRSTHSGNSEKPTTARALILRNGKHGARGTGELMLVTKLSGREKLDLLAGKHSWPKCNPINSNRPEDLVERSRTAVMSPFRLEECLKIAESQCNGMYIFHSSPAYHSVRPLSILGRHHQFAGSATLYGSYPG